MPIFFISVDMEPPGFQTFSLQKPLYHPTSRERIFQMQFVDPAHQCQITVRHWAWQIIDAAATEAEKLRLTHHG